MVDAPIAVEARFNAEGRVTVRSFTYQGRRHAVVGHGRQWLAKDGRHVLVMTAGERIFELAFAAQAGVWRLVRAPGGPAAA